MSSSVNFEGIVTRKDGSIFFSHQEAFGAIHIIDGFFQVREKKWSILPEEVEITPVDLPVSKSDEDVTNGVYFALFVKCAEMVLVIFI